ncbi:MAG: hypothetical protein ACOYL8_04325 [Patescibacteria group bacterium]
MSFKFENMSTQKSETESHDHHHDLFNAAWEKSSENFLIKGLKEGKKLEDLLNEMPGFKEAYSEKSLLENPDCCFECSDGRVVTSGIKVAIAGEGILLNESDRKILENVLKDKQISISGHEGCGAAGMAHPGPDSDKYGYAGAEKLAADTGNKYQEVHHESFRSPVHDERSLVIEGTLRFNCASWKEFPAQFIASSAALGLSEEYIATEAKALTGIALGDHGMGERFTKENPFYIIISAKDQEQLDNLTKISEVAIEDFGDRVKVTGFIAPTNK